MKWRRKKTTQNVYWAEESSRSNGKKPGENGTIKKAYMQLLYEYFVLCYFSLSLRSVSDRFSLFCCCYFFFFWHIIAIATNMHGVWASGIKKAHAMMNMNTQVRRTNLKKKEFIEIFNKMFSSCFVCTPSRQATLPASELVGSGCETDKHTLIHSSTHTESVVRYCLVLCPKEKDLLIVCHVEKKKTRKQAPNALIPPLSIISINNHSFVGSSQTQYSRFSSSNFSRATSPWFASLYGILVISFNTYTDYFGRNCHRVAYFPYHIFPPPRLWMRAGNAFVYYLFPFSASSLDIISFNLYDTPLIGHKYIDRVRFFCFFSSIWIWFLDICKIFTRLRNCLFQMQRLEAPQ